MESKINQCKEKHQRLTWLWFPQWLALHHFICLLNTQASRRGILERHLGLETCMLSIEQTQGRNLSPTCIVYTENGQNNKPSSSSLLSVLKMRRSFGVFASNSKGVTLTQTWVLIIIYLFTNQILL